MENLIQALKNRFNNSEVNINGKTIELVMDNFLAKIEIYQEEDEYESHYSTYNVIWFFDWNKKKGFLRPISEKDFEASIPNLLASLSSDYYESQED